MVLPLSSPDKLADWIKEEVSQRLVESLDSARGVISTRVVDFDDHANLPAELHRACTMMAAAMHQRSDSIYGVDAFAVGNEAGVGFLMSDPTINMLLAPWLRPTLGVAERV